MLTLVTASNHLSLVEEGMQLPAHIANIDRPAHTNFSGLTTLYERIPLEALEYRVTLRHDLSTVFELTMPDAQLSGSALQQCIDQQCQHLAQRGRCSTCFLSRLYNEGPGELIDETYEIAVSNLCRKRH